MTACRRLNLGVEICLNHGWGIHAYFLAKRVMERGLADEVRGEKVNLPDRERSNLTGKVSVATDWNAPTIYALGGHPLGTVVPRLAHRCDRIIQVFEVMGFGAREIAALNFGGAIVTVSQWNCDALGEVGVRNVVCSHLGVDTTFYAPPDVPVDPDRPFTIFSGGKAEFRKGQDIVVEAFRRFNARRPESRLVTMWHSPWPGSAHSLDASPHTSGAPAAGSGSGARLELGAWLANNGVPAGAWSDGGRYFERVRLLDTLRSADAAVFPNRCEGGTNMVAMECIAAGVPTVLSRNSGHIDLLADNLGIPLTIQRPVMNFADANAYWGESDVDELVDALESIYADRSSASKRARQAALRMRAWDWPIAIDRQIESLDLPHALALGYP